MADLKMKLVALFAAVAVPAVAAELPAGVIAVPLSRDAGLTAYYAEFHVGTPPQKSSLKIDTGSPMFSFLDPRNSVCTSQDCKTFGTFDNTTSSTCHYEGPGFYDYLSVLGNGDYLNDTLVLGGVTLENMYFGYTSSYVRPDRVTGNVATILGLSLDCQGGGPECTGKGPVLLPQLKNASIIDSMSTSIYLGRDDWDVKNARILIGGAYDKAKVDGDMFTIDMVNPHDLQLANGQTNSVNVTSTEVVIDNGNGTAINRTAETYGNKDVGVPVLLDTGIAAWYMTETIFAAVYHGLGGRGDVPAGTRYVPVDCIYRDPSYTKSYVSVGFGTAGTVKVPLHALVSQYEDGSCGSFIMARGDTVSTMGDPFLRGVYSIFDQENWTISLGQVRHTDEEDIVPIPKGGFKAER